MNLGILLWNTCNAKCAHCAVSSGPREVASMSDEEIFALIDGAFHDGDEHPKIGLSGGEAFLHFERLCRIVQYATDKGAHVAINTNGFWGITIDVAHKKVETLKRLKVSHLTVSVDDFHEAYIPRKRVLNVVKACRKAQLLVRIQYVATKTTHRLADFLKESGDDLLNIECREIPCQPVGRAETLVPDEDLFLDTEIPQGKCPSAILSVSASGNVIPCCNSAGHLPALKIGTIREPLRELQQRFSVDPVIFVLRFMGPAALLDVAIEAGYVPRSDGYVDQCHLCYELFKDPSVATAIRVAAKDLMADTVRDNLTRQYKENRGWDYAVSPEG